MLVGAMCAGCSSPKDGEYRDITKEIEIHAILPTTPCISWTKEDFDKYAFVAPPSVSSNQPAWTPIIPAGKITRVRLSSDQDGNSYLLFCVRDRALIHSMIITFFDRGVTRFRLLVHGVVMAEFEDKVGMGFGGGSWTLTLKTSDSKKMRAIVKAMRER